MEFIPAALHAALQPLLDTIADMTKRIRAYDKQIEMVSKTVYPETTRLLQVPGVGPVTSLAFVLTIEDSSRFKKARDVGPFLGLVPRQRQSGDCELETLAKAEGVQHPRFAKRVSSRGQDESSLAMTTSFPLQPPRAASVAPTTDKHAKIEVLRFMRILLKRSAKRPTARQGSAEEGHT